MEKVSYKTRSGLSVLTVIVKHLRAVADLLLPRKCIVCGRTLNLHETHICLFCMADLPLTHFWQRLHNPMADKYNDAIREHILKYESYSSACSLFYYSAGNDYRHITHSVKYNGNIKAGLHFGKILGKYMAKSQHFNDIDLITPVPLHWTRQLRRGYNQAEIIAKGICSELNVPIEPKLLRRRKRTKSQTTLDVCEKKENVKNAFETDRTTYKKHKEARHILIVDDVFTTGATLQSCHHALRKHYGTDVRISIATLGFVES